MRASTLIAASLAAGLLAPLPVMLSAHADGLTDRPDILAAKDLKPGMKGYGLTVFEGTAPSKFDVEIIDVLPGFLPRQELILVKTHHPRLEVAKVVAGMSGSPIFIDGKMIGAYSYGWTFGAEPVAGVTPIKAMLDDLVRPLPKSVEGWPLSPLPAGNKGKKASTRGASRPGSSPNRFAGLPSDYDVLKHSRQIEKRLSASLPGSGNLMPVATPILMGGTTSGAIDFARELLSPLGLEPLQGGGSGATDASAPARFVDGGAIGVELIRGDMSAMGLGTVTRVEGDKLLGFGHPMMQAGVSALPTAIGKVLWFLASDMRSFKLGYAVRPVGALVNDRQASIVVSHSARAPVIPVRLKIKGVEGAPFTTWNFEVAHEKFMTPSFLAVALGSALQHAASEHIDASWNAVSKLRIQGYGEVTLEDFGVSVGGTPDPRDMIRSNLVRAIGGLLNNPWQNVIIEGCEMELELRFQREIYRLRGAEVLEPEIDAGEPARIRLTLVPFAGPEVTRVISVPIPKELAGQTVRMEISPGYTVEKEQADPENLGELVRNLEDTIYPPKSVIISFSTGDGVVAYAGHLARNLPPGALDAMRPTASTVAPISFGGEIRHVEMLPQFMTGNDRVQVKVRKVIR